MGKHGESNSLQLQPGLLSEPPHQIEIRVAHTDLPFHGRTCAHTYTQAPTHACKYLFAQTNMLTWDSSSDTLQKWKKKRLFSTSYFQND